MATEPDDAQLACQLREAHDAVRRHTKELKARGYDVSKRGANVLITKTKTETIDL